MIRKILIGFLTFLIIGCGTCFIQNPFGGNSSDGRFIAYYDGTVLDKKSGLMWAANDNGKGVNREEAKNYCDSYRGGGYTDWRMPTQDELVGLYEANKTFGTFCQGFFPFIFCQDIHVTSMIRLTGEYVFASEIRDSDYAFVYSASGHPNWVRPKRAINGRVLPVRYVK